MHQLLQSFGTRVLFPHPLVWFEPPKRKIQVASNASQQARTKRRRTAAPANTPDVPKAAKSGVSQVQESTATLVGAPANVRAAGTPSSYDRSAAILHDNSNITPWADSSVAARSVRDDDADTMGQIIHGQAVVEEQNADQDLDENERVLPGEVPPPTMSPTTMLLTAAPPLLNNTPTSNTIPGRVS